jgi:phospholipid-binding lipoprotein MlaA
MKIIRFLFLFCALSTTYLLTNLIPNLQAATLPAGYLQALDQVAKTIEEDANRRQMNASLNVSSARNVRWEHSLVSSVVSRYWSAYPGSSDELLQAAQQRFPWFNSINEIPANQSPQYQRPNYSDQQFVAAVATNTVLFPSSQYQQPSLQAYNASYTVATSQPRQIVAKNTKPPVSKKEQIRYPIIVSDPIEGFNRGVFYFNAKFDQYIFVPATDLYKWVTPEFLETGIHNMFENITEIMSFLNELLQIEFVDAGKTALRFGLNTTVGVLGFFDPAKHVGLPQDKEDFGQTLGSWGVGNGPYIVLPILGPSNLRDTTGLIVDSAAFSALDPFNIAEFKKDYPAIYALQSVDTRASIDYRYHKSGSPFEYELIRYLISKKRELDILK